MFVYTLRNLSRITPCLLALIFTSFAWAEQQPAAVEADAPAGEVEEHDTLKDTLFGGKVNLDLRFRFEYADFNDTGAPGWGHVETARLRLGYGTKPLNGFSAYGEFEGVFAADDETYNDTLNGQVTRAVIADPEVTELNQLFGKYEDHGFTLKAGRQRIILDNARFVGNVGWRQDEQTYDAASFAYEGFDDVPVLEDMSFYYAYLWKINRIFADEGDFDSNSHLINIGYDGLNIGTLTGFAYLLDFNGDSPANDGNTIGFRFNGKQDLSDEYALGYEFSYAHQFDAGPMRAFDTDYYMVGGSITKKSWNTTFGVSYEVLASDNGMYGFRTPLATLHGYQGWADAFLVTPANGIQDLYAYIGTTLPFEIKGKVVGHMYYEEHGSDPYGYEIDAVASKAITEWMSVLAKVAYFEGDGTTAGAPGDRVRFWLQMEIKY